MLKNDYFYLLIVLVNAISALLNLFSTNYNFMNVLIGTANFIIVLFSIYVIGSEYQTELKRIVGVS